MASRNDRNDDTEKGAESSSSAEAIAEWVVRAQLKIKQPKKKAASFTVGDSNPTSRVVYKWNSSNDHDTKRNPHEKISLENCRPTNEDAMRASCSIVLTTDVYPTDVKDSSGFNTHTYTFEPSQAQVICDCQHSEQSPVVSKDASCQTSDSEMAPWKAEKSKTLPSRKYLYNDHRRATESFLSPRGQSEGKLIPPSYAHKNLSPTRSNPSSHSSNDKKKPPPRTVHIDVYCTGSENETSNSSASSSPNIIDDFENLMAQKSVFEKDDMVLRQRIAGRHELPRKFAKDQKSKTSTTAHQAEHILDLSHAVLQNSINRREELNESKQMLFQKYLGDQRQVQKFNDLRSLLRHDISDDTISSNYPNSSYSTVRDLTRSSIANSPSTVFEDSTFLTEVLANLPDNFLKLERNEIKMKNFESFWGQEVPPRDLYSQNKLMQNFSFFNDNSENLSDSHRSNDLGNISDSNPPTVISFKNKEVGAESSNLKDTSPSQSTKKKETYSKDHLEIAQKFGSVMRSMRKPGHHVGPVKNPTCLCETCKRWMLERDKVQTRDRAFSFGDTPITKTSFWRRNNRYYV